MSTSTSTCRTPGWFGCNDETTTTSKTASHFPTATKTSSATSSLTTCHSKGFFGGCLDSTITSSSSSASPTSGDCRTPGFFWGCKDESTTQSQTHTITPPPLPTTSMVSPTTSSHECTSSAWFGLICIDPSPTAEPTSTPTHTPHKRSHCVHRSWLGFCKKWEGKDNDLKEEI